MLGIYSAYVSISPLGITATQEGTLSSPALFAHPSCDSVHWESDISIYFPKTKHPKKHAGESC